MGLQMYFYVITPTNILCGVLCCQYKPFNMITSEREKTTHKEYIIVHIYWFVKCEENEKKKK